MTEHMNDYQYWDERADRFDSASTVIIGAKAQQAMRNWLRDQLHPEDRALEIGCGTGFFSVDIAQKVQHLTATDLSPEMLSRAQARLYGFSNVSVQFADAYRTQFTAESFDVVFMANVVHIVEEPLTVLREAHRVLKNSGRLLVLDVTLVGMPLLAKLGMALRVLRLYGMPQRATKNLRLKDFVKLVQILPFEIADAQIMSYESNILCVCAIKTE